MIPSTHRLFTLLACCLLFAGCTSGDPPAEDPRTNAKPVGADGLIARTADMPTGSTHHFLFRGNTAAVLINANGVFRAYINMCDHEGGPVTLDEGSLVCQWHDAQFDPATGALQQGPATGPLSAIPVTVKDGGVYLTEALKTEGTVVATEMPATPTEAPPAATVPPAVPTDEPVTPSEAPETTPAPTPAPTAGPTADAVTAASPQVIARTSEIPPGSTLEFDHNGRDAIIVNFNGLYRAYINKCDHADGPNELRDTAVVCKWHGSQFDPETGALERGPATAPLEQIQLTIIGDKIYAA